MTNLDDYLSTPDEYFNQEAQFWYFYWIGEKKINSNKPVEVFMRALYDGYFFILENFKRPFTCVEKLKEISQQSGFTLDENKVYINRIEDIVQKSKKRKEMILTFLQIMAYRQEIEPLDPKEWEATEEDIKELLPFEFEDIKAEFQNISDLVKKHKYLTNLLFDFEYKEFLFEDVAKEYYEKIGLKHWIKTELHRCEYEMKLAEKSDKPYDYTKGEENEKTDFKELLFKKIDQTNEIENLKVEEENKKLKHIREAVIFDDWNNGAFAQIRYNAGLIWHQVVYYHYVGETPYLDYPDIDIVNDTIKFPVVTRGFTAFLIQSMGKPEMDIFNRYYEKCLYKYKEIESKKPGSSLRNLEAEFYPIHISIEKESIAFSEKIYPFIDKKEIELINQYIEAYFKYIEQFSIEQQPYGYPKGEKPKFKLIIFKDQETIELIHSVLKGYFPNKEAELLKALQGEQLSEILLFPHNQNKFVEVFRRLKYNGFLLNNDTETKNWICTTFKFVKKRFAEPQPFNQNSVWDNLNKGKGEPTKKERICNTEWLPHKSPLQLTRETENEKL